MVLVRETAGRTSDSAHTAVVDRLVASYAAVPPAGPVRLAKRTGLPLTEAADHVAAQSSRDALVETSGQVRTAAVPSGTNLLGLVKHLAHVERFVFLGEKPASGDSSQIFAGMAGMPSSVGWPRTGPECEWSMWLRGGTSSRSRAARAVSP